MKRERIWEIDFLRGVAIALMVLFHLVYDLTEFYNWQLDYKTGFWVFIRRLSAVLFIFVAGISSNFSSGSFSRVGQVCLAAILVTAATYFFDRSLYVRFGILHFIAMCMLMAIFLQKLKFKSVIISVSILAAIIIFYVYNVFFDFYTAFSIWGITSAPSGSMDYYPLIPWAGIFVLGLAWGKVFYVGKRRLLAAKLAGLPIVKALAFCGRNSLFIYLAHQPVLLLMLYFIRPLR
ncbi:MAG: DUF1624 domain-containing protein [Sporomusaceae bacterium]|jgi:uncharacterized membrane protein|nr:DUF1624 domain-containing protein [Sporomusaceae bacterium]